MPTKPIEDIHPKYLDKRDEKNLANCSSVVDEIVNYGTHVLDWCKDARPGKPEVLPVIAQFREVLDLLDAISILVRSGTGDPCKNLLRSAIEATMSILYILEKDTEQRARCFTYWPIREKLLYYEKLDPTTPEGQKFATEMANDRFIKTVNTPQNLQSLKQAELNLLNMACYVPIEAEYQRMKSKKSKLYNWFNLFDGPKSIRQLMHQVNFISTYEFLYSSYSGKVHATDVINQVIIGIANAAPGDENAEILQLRNLSNLRPVLVNTINFSIILYKEMTKYFVPSRQPEVNIWYLQEIRSFFISLLDNA